MKIPKKFKEKYESIICLSQYDYNLGDITDFLQVGNGKPLIETFKFIDTGGLYIYRVQIDETELKSIRISIISKDKKQCVYIIINQNTNISALISISDTNNCVYEGLNKSIGKSGSKMLKVALNLILNYKNKYNIKRIVLKDTSYIACDNCDKPVKLAQIRTVLKGEPWFSSYGFKPLDNFKPSKSKLKELQNNNKIFDTLKTSDVNILYLVNLAIKKQKINNDIKEIVILMNNYPLMRNFIIRLTNEFDKYCCILTYILEYLFHPKSKTGLTDFYNQTFYLDI